MKVILTSDTHKERERIKSVRDFAKANGIDTIIDCGDLHGEISAYDGINLHAVYWGEASGRMEWWDFDNGVRSIGGTVHGNGSTFVIGDTAIYIQHNLAGYKDQIPEDALAHAKQALDDLVEREGREMDRLVLFGHTHNFHYSGQDGVLALNPGSLGIGDPNGFIVLDMETKAVEYRTVDDVILRIDENEHVDKTQIRRLLVMNPEENRLQYIARLRNGKEVAVMGDEISPEHDSIICIDSAGHAEDPEERTRMLRIRKDGRDAWVRLDNVQTPAYDEIRNAPLLDQGVPYFVATDGEESQVLVRDWQGSHEELARYKEIEFHTLRIADGVFAVQAIDEDDRSLVNVNGAETKRYDLISDLKLLDGMPVFRANDGDEDLVVVGDREYRRHKRGKDKYSSVISSLSIVDGKPAYAAEHDGEQTVYLGDEAVAGPFPVKDRWTKPVKMIGEADGLLAILVEEDGRREVHVGGEVIPLEGNFHTFLNEYKQGDKAAEGATADTPDEQCASDKVVYVYVTSLDKSTGRSLRQSVEAVYGPERIVVGDNLREAVQSGKYSLVIDTSTLGRPDATSGVVAHDMKYIDVDKPPEIMCVNNFATVVADIGLAVARHYGGGEE